MASRPAGPAATAWAPDTLRGWQRQRQHVGQHVVARAGQTFGSCRLSTPLCSCVVAIVRWRRCCRTRGRSLHTQLDLDGCLLGARRRHDIVGDRCPPSVRVSARLCGTLVGRCRHGWSWGSKLSIFETHHHCDALAELILGHCGAPRVPVPYARYRGPKSAGFLTT